MCTFCRIIAGELPSRMIYEDKKACVFLDISGDVDAWPHFTVARMTPYEAYELLK